MIMQSFEKVNEQMRCHNEYLSPYATRDQDAIRFEKEEEDFRPPFFHDTDRILYSMAYTRYMDKTQVFSYQENDHVSKRMVHVQLVSKIARTIGRALGLNEDLIEAASLGHDLGHTPFGHVGEAILNQLSLEYQEGYFNHNIQSVRMLLDIEHGGEGSNLTLQVLDAIMCHNGSFVSKNYGPVSKSKEEFLKQYQSAYQNESVIKEFVPMTLEGCVVRLSDMIAYLGRDIDDACALKVFQKEQLPKQIVDVLGSKNKEMINTIILDIIHHSFGKSSLSMSDSVYQAMKALKAFNMEHIYAVATKPERYAEYEKMIRLVFTSCLDDVQKQNISSPIYQDFLNYKKERYQQNTSDARKVLDYVSGMTDDYLVHIYLHYKP